LGSGYFDLGRVVVVHDMQLVSYYFGRVTLAMHSEAVIKILNKGPAKPASE
jgi:hypothetical protein